MKKLKEDYLNAKINRYFDLIPQVLHDMFPDFDNLNDGIKNSHAIVFSREDTNYLSNSDKKEFLQCSAKNRPKHSN